MNKKGWEKVIKDNCIKIGTYNAAFGPVISSLAEILEKRDSILESYNGEPIVEHTNSHGETNAMKNPSLMLWLDCDKLALSYWRELGLTSAALKKINEAAIKPEKKENSLAEAIRELGG